MGAYAYGKTSRRRLETCHKEIRRVFDTAIGLGLMDISIVEGVRPRARQDAYFRARPQKSRVKWPNGKHNVTRPGQKSRAVDAAPYIDGDISWAKVHCVHLAGIVLAVAAMLGVKMRWGGNWDLDAEPVTDQDFQDLVHYELL